MIKRSFSAVILGRQAYKDIEMDVRSLVHAGATVVLVGIAFGLGIRNVPVEGLKDAPTMVVLTAIVAVILGWVVWALVGFVIGTRLMGGKASYRMTLRVLGLAYGPGIFMASFSIPVVGREMYVVSLFWLLAAATVAVHESQGFSWLRAFSITSIGWFLALSLPIVPVSPLGIL